MWHTFLVLTFSTSLLSSFTVFGQDSYDSTSSLHANDEYSHIHRSIPVLFEYLLVALEGKPEVLESNSAVAFNNQANDENGSSKRDADYQNYNGDYTEFSRDYDYDEVNEFGTIRALADGNENGSLNPKDIEQKILLAEEKLEEHNNKKK